MSTPNEPLPRLHHTDLVAAVSVLEGYADGMREALDDGDVRVDETMIAEAAVDSCRRVAVVLRTFLGDDEVHGG